MPHRSAIERFGVYAAGFGAAAILLGYFFEIGFIGGLDERLLQFLTVQDYLVVSAQYIFPFLAILFVISLANLGQFLVARTTFSDLFKRQRTSEEVDDILRKSSYYIFGVAGIILAVGVGFIMYSKFVNPVKEFNEIESILHGTCGLVGGAGVFVLFLSQLKYPRKFELLVPIALIGFAVATAFLYGELEGQLVFKKTNPDAVIGLSSGKHLNIILLQRISAGIVYRASRDNAVYFIPDSQIVAIKLFGNTGGGPGWVF